jgi:hypothetical protein
MKAKKYPRFGLLAVSFFTAVGSVGCGYGNNSATERSEVLDLKIKKGNDELEDVATNEPKRVIIRSGGVDLLDFEPLYILPTGSSLKVQGRFIDLSDRKRVVERLLNGGKSKVQVLNRTPSDATFLCEKGDDCVGLVLDTLNAEQEGHATRVEIVLEPESGSEAALIVGLTAVTGRSPTSVSATLVYDSSDFEMIWRDPPGTELKTVPVSG